MRFFDQVNILLEVFLDDVALHFLIIFGALSSFFASLFFLLLNSFGGRNKKSPLSFLVKEYVFNFLRKGGFLGKVLFINAEGPDHINVEFLTEDDIIFKSGLYFEIILKFFVEIAKHKHAVGNFFLEEGDFLLN